MNEDEFQSRKIAALEKIAEHIENISKNGILIVPMEI